MQKYVYECSSIKIRSVEGKDFTGNCANSTDFIGIRTCVCFGHFFLYYIKQFVEMEALAASNEKNINKMGPIQRNNIRSEQTFGVYFIRFLTRVDEDIFRKYVKMFCRLFRVSANIIVHIVLFFVLSRNLEGIFI